MFLWLSFSCVTGSIVLLKYNICYTIRAECIKEWKESICKSIDIHMCIDQSINKSDRTKLISDKASSDHLQCTAPFWFALTILWCILLAFILSSKTQTLWGSLFFCTAHSSNHATFCQSFTVQCQCTFAHLQCWATCHFVKKGRSSALHFHIPSSCNHGCKVCSHMLIPVSTCNCVKDTRVSDLAIWMIYRWSATDVLRGLPEHSRLLMDLCLLAHCRKLLAVCW
jgi:hypothetical protein